jgi:hypothetical protein
MNCTKCGQEIADGQKYVFDQAPLTTIIGGQEFVTSRDLGAHHETCPPNGSSRR